MSRQRNESEHVRWARPRTRLRRPTLIAAFEGWNDAGDAATIAARFLAKRWWSEPVAEIDAEPFFDFTSTRPVVTLNDRKTRGISWPSNEVRTALITQARRDAVLLIGTEPQLKWRTFTEQVISLAGDLGVERVVTLGALLAEVPHSREVEVFGTAEDDDLREQLDLKPSTYEGPTGIVGVLSSACRDAGFPTASFWSAVPSYMPSKRSPKAALALVNRVCALMDIELPTSELEQGARAYEREVAGIVSQDDETAEYVARLEKAWDAGQARAMRRAPMTDDPDLLVAEVEQFLRDTPR